MTESLHFRPEVVNDLEHAANWYDDRRIGLGAEFLQECKAALSVSVQSANTFDATSILCRGGVVVDSMAATDSV